MKMKMKNLMKARIISVVMIASSFIFAFSAQAAPSIGGVSGTVSDGNAISISGSDFGPSGPNVRLFDNFQGTPGELVSMQATVGNWSGTNNTPPSYIADEGANVSALTVDSGVRQLKVSFADSQEAYLSYRVRVPLGYFIPGHTDPSNDIEVTQSSWKFAWLMDNYCTMDDDYCLPSRINNGNFAVGGNDTAFTLYTGKNILPNRWFSMLGWNGFSVWLKGGTPNPRDVNGYAWASGASQEFGRHIYSKSGVIFDGYEPDKYCENDIDRWNSMTMPGWIGGSKENVRAIYDDVYLAIGPNSAARVEIGNTADYGSSTKLAIATPSSWSDNSISVTVREGNFAPGEQAYLFVVDSNNNPSVGYPITFSSTSESDAATPVVPEEPIDGSAPNPDPISTTPGYSVSDFANILLEWMKSGTSLQGDVNKDGTVNSMDLGVIMSNWE